MGRFVHLHVHSQYSFLDGADTATSLVSRAAALGMGAIAITDHNNVSAAVELSRAAAEFGIRPIHGVELDIASHPRLPDPHAYKASARSAPSHLTLLAQGHEGYSNLCRIITEAHLSSERHAAEATLEMLENYSHGLIALSGCKRGAIPSLVAARRFDDALAVARELVRIFGRSNLYIELQNTLTPGASAANSTLAELAQRLGVGIVATNNVHYANKERFQVHDALTCVRTLTTLDDIHPERHINAENYLKAPAEMADIFAGFPEAIASSTEIAERCSPGLDLSLQLFPKFQATHGEPSAQCLRRLAMEGALDRYGAITPKIQSRLEHELNIITALGFEDYFLAVWDVALWARSRGIRYAGRGSAADSAVAYCLRLTNVDSIARGLLFERFMSIERAQKPDIDIDFDARKRDDVANYVYERYGKGHVATVCTFSAFRGRSAVRDFGKALGFPNEDIDRFAKLLPHVPADGIRAAFSRYPEMRDSGIPAWKFELLLTLGESVAGFPRHIGTHLGGVVISSKPLTCATPLQMAAKGVEIIQFDKDCIEDLGLIKLDLLSLRTLSAVEQAVTTVREASPGFSYDSIPQDDLATYQMLNRGETVGAFQLESPAQHGLQTRLGADCIEDIVASVALIRPGPIQGQMVEPFIARRTGKEKVTYIDPRLAHILDKTYGVVLYQEQVIEIATAIAGFTPGESDRLRKVMTHFRSVREMEEIGRDFVAKAVAHGVEQKTAEAVFSYIVGYAGYGFCEAHAAAFADTSYKTAYMIRHFPAHFYAAVLSAQPMGFYPPRTLLVEVGRRGVKVMPLDINLSHERYTVENKPGSETGAIRVGLMQVGGAPKDVIHRIISVRDEGGPFRSPFDFVCRVDPPRPALQNLALTGAFDSIAPNRRAILWRLSRIIATASSYKTISASDGMAGQERLLGLDCGVGIGTSPDEQADGMDLEGLPEGFADFTPVEKFKYETSILGFCVAHHAMDFFRPALSRAGVITSQDLAGAQDGQAVQLAGLVVRPHRPPTKSGKIIVFLSLEDEFGLSDVTIFENVYQKYGSAIFGSPALLVAGIVSRRGNGVSVTARQVQPLSKNSMPRPDASRTQPERTPSSLCRSQARTPREEGRAFEPQNGQCHQTAASP
ncbi:MAG: DNA polymerase III subunit alpha [Clostridia bacterium]|nr:DNA polymerase III subunit alpha [Clostridia bacterium]